MNTIRKGFILTVLLLSVAALAYSQTTLTGTYRFGTTNATISFSGNSFTGAWNKDTPMSGQYAISGSRLTLNITSGPKVRESWIWTVVDVNTLRDHDGDIWRRVGAASSGTGSGSSSGQRVNIVPASSYAKNWISGEVNILGAGVMYERMLNKTIGIGANVYWNTLILWNELGADFVFRIHPGGGAFYFGTAVGYHIHTGDYEYKTYSGYTGTFFGAVTGVAVTPELGWRIDFGDPGGFFMQPGVRVPITFGLLESYGASKEAFAFGWGVVPYIGFGFAFGL
jgi:hypothetical protein